MLEFFFCKRFVLRLCSSMLLALLLSSCFAHRDKVNADLFTLRTRLIELEQKLKLGQGMQKSTIQSAAKKQATVGVVLEKVEMDLLKIRGDIDTFNVAFRTGRIPGRTNEESIGKILSEVAERVQAIESTQKIILELLDKKKNGRNRKTLKKLASFNSAFKAKKYQHVVEDAPLVMNHFKKEDKALLRYLFSESLFKVGRLREAALSFDAMLADEVLPKKRAAMQLRLGDCFRHLGDKKAASVYYSELLEAFPETDEAARASRLLSK